MIYGSSRVPLPCFARRPVDVYPLLQARAPRIAESRGIQTLLFRHSRRWLEHQDPADPLYPLRLMDEWFRIPHPMRLQRPLHVDYRPGRRMSRISQLQGLMSWPSDPAEPPFPRMELLALKRNGAVTCPGQSRRLPRQFLIGAELSGVANDVLLAIPLLQQDIRHLGSHRPNH